MLVMRDAKPESDEELHSWRSKEKKWTALRTERAAARPIRNSYTSVVVL